MRYVRPGLVLAATLPFTACFQLTTVVKVSGDASGTIDQRLVFSQAAMGQLKQFAALGGSNGKPFDPISEEQARADAARLGPGATYVSSIAIDDGTGQGRATVYAFTDINQLRVNQHPGAPAGVSVRAQGMDSDRQAITFRLATQPNGNALLTITVPQPNFPSGGMSGGGTTMPSVEQMAMLKQMFGGARVTIAVEPAGTLVRTSSAFVEGPRVTLLDVNLDQVLKDDTFLSRIQAAKTEDDMKGILREAPGLKINLDREITIEFTPAK
jgi:hypothetical protein